MGTIADKLTYLNGTKEAIKQAINEDFEVIDNNTTFREYADEISSNNAKYKDLIPKETKNATNTLDISNSAGLDKALVTQYGNTKQSILPSEYTQVDYIQSSGTQYIDTGFKPNQNTRMTAKVYINGLVGQYNNIGGARTSNTKQFHIIIASDRFDGRYGTQDSNISYTTTGLFNFDFNKNQLYINNSLANTFTDTTFSSDYNAYIFAVNNTGSATQMADYKLYNMKWYDNDTLARDFIPCYRNSDNEVGLYDLVNNVFYVNQGTGAFTYGSVIPNPNYPQEIVNISGKSTLKDVGKNLFDGVLELGNFNSNTGEKLANNNYIINTNPIPVEELTNYKISSNGTGIRMYVFEYKEDMTYNLNTRKTVNDNEYLTTNSGTKYINFRTIDVNTNLQEKIQVEKGTSLTSFEAYKGQSYTINLGSIELCKIGDYRDRIYYSSGKWYLEKKIGKVVLNGSENWNSWYNTSNDNIGFYYFNNDIVMIGNEEDYNNLLYCDKFSEPKLRTSIVDGEVEGIKKCGGTGIPYIGLGIAKTYLSDWSTRENAIASLKTWLSNNNTEVQFPLATPITTEITESNYPTLYEQLNNIKLYEGVNHLTFTNESGLDVEFDIEYYKDWKLD